MLDEVEVEDALLAGLAPSTPLEQWLSLSVSLLVRFRWSLFVPEVQHGQFLRMLERMEQRRFDLATPPSSAFKKKKINK